MEDFDTAEVVALDWSDANFFGFMWVNDGKDLRVLLRHASRPIAGLICHRASDLRVDLIWSRPQDSTSEHPIRRCGPLLTGYVTFSLDDEDRWHLLLDFLSYGHLECECGGITMINPEKIV